jgi:hypothetical protein
MRILSTDLTGRNASISRVTHGDAFDRGEASSTRNCDASRPRAIDVQRAGLAERVVLSRKMRSPRRYHGRAKRASARSMAAASLLSSA